MRRSKEKEMRISGPWAIRLNMLVYPALDFFIFIESYCIYFETYFSPFSLGTLFILKDMDYRSKLISLSKNHLLWNFFFFLFAVINNTKMCV